MSNLFSGSGRGSLGSVAEQDNEQRGVDRRTLIKRAAATGAVAWTAPLIIDSLTSPAAALTCAGECFRFQILADQDCGSVSPPRTETVSTISPCGTLTAAACATTTDVTAGLVADDFNGGVCTDIDGGISDCRTQSMTFRLSTMACTWGGGGTCNGPRRFLAAQANTNTGCVAGSIDQTRSGAAVTFTLPAGQQWQHFQFIVGCSCA
jgi:hypothetical protein